MIGFLLRCARITHSPVSARDGAYLHLCSLGRWHFKYSDRVWQKLESDNNSGSFQYSTPCDWAADTNSYLLLSDQTHEPYRYRRAGQYTSLPPKGLHLLSEMIFNKVWPRKYRVECSCLDLAYGVKEEKNTLLELRWKSRLPEETALRFLCQCRVVHFILCCSGTKPQSSATHEPWGCNGMPLWNI